jgi:hypothetical protein
VSSTALLSALCVELAIDKGGANYIRFRQAGEFPEIDANLSKYRFVVLSERWRGPADHGKAAIVVGRELSPLGPGAAGARRSRTQRAEPSGQQARHVQNADAGKG